MSTSNDQFNLFKAFRERPVQHVLFIVVVILALAAINVAFEHYIYNENDTFFIKVLSGLVASVIVLTFAAPIAHVLDIGYPKDNYPKQSTIESKEYDAVKQAIDSSDDEEEDLIK